MSFRRLFTLKSVLCPAFSQNSVLQLSTLSSNSIFSKSIGASLSGSCIRNKRNNSSYSPFVSTGVTRTSTGPTLVPFGGLREIQLFLNSSPSYFCQGRNVHRGRTRYSETSKSCPDEKKKDESPEKKMTIFQKFKAMYRDYWYVLVPVHVVTSGIFFGSFYYMARMGVDVAALAEWAHFGEDIVEKIRKSGNSTTGHLAIAYLLYKVITPVRYTVTIGGTTISINYLKKWGWIKPIPKRHELRKMYDDKKVELRKKRDQLRERKELMKKSVMSKLPSKKRIKTPPDTVNKVLARKKNARKG